MYLTKKHLYDEQRIPIASLIDSCTETRSDIVYNYGVLVMFGKTVSFIRPAYFDHSYPQKIEYTHEQTVFFMTDEANLTGTTEKVNTFTHVCLVRYVDGGTMVNPGTGNSQPTIDCSYPVDVLLKCQRSLCQCLCIEGDTIVLKKPLQAAKKDTPAKTTQSPLKAASPAEPPLPPRLIPFAELDQEKSTGDVNYSYGIIDFFKQCKGFINTRFQSKGIPADRADNTAVIFHSTLATIQPQNVYFNTLSFIYLVRYATNGTIQNPATGKHHPAIDYSVPITILKELPRAQCHMLQIQEDGVLLQEKPQAPQRNQAPKQPREQSMDASDFEKCLSKLSMSLDKIIAETGYVESSLLPDLASKAGIKNYRQYAAGVVPFIKQYLPKYDTKPDIIIDGVRHPNVIILAGSEPKFKPKEKESSAAVPPVNEEHLQELSRLFEEGRYVEYLRSPELAQNKFCALPRTYQEMTLACADRLLYRDPERTIQLDLLQTELIDVPTTALFYKKWTTISGFQKEILEACARTCWPDFVIPENTRDIASLLSALGKCNGNNDNYKGLSLRFATCYNTLTPCFYLLRLATTQSENKRLETISEYCQLVKNLNRIKNHSSWNNEKKLFGLPNLITCIYELYPETELPANIVSNIASTYLDCNCFENLNDVLTIVGRFGSPVQSLLDLYHNSTAWTRKQVEDLLSSGCSVQLYQKTVAHLWECYCDERVIPDHFLRILSWLVTLDNNNSADEFLRYHFIQDFNKRHRQSQLINSLERICQLLPNDSDLYTLASYITNVVVEDMGETFDPAPLNPLIDTVHHHGDALHAEFMNALDQLNFENRYNLCPLFNTFRFDFERRTKLQADYTAWYRAQRIFHEFSEEDQVNELNTLYNAELYDTYIAMIQDMNVLENDEQQFCRFINALINARRFREAIQYLENASIPMDVKKPLIIHALAENFRINTLTPKAFDVFSDTFSVDSAHTLLLDHLRASGTTPGVFPVINSLLALCCHRKEFCKALYLYKIYQTRAENGYTRLYSKLRSVLPDAAFGKINNFYDVIELAFFALSTDGLLEFFKWVKSIPIPQYKELSFNHAFQFHYDKFVEDPLSVMHWTNFHRHLIKRFSKNLWLIVVCENVISKLSGDTSMANTGIALDLILDQVEVRKMPYNLLPYAFSYMMAQPDSTLCDKLLKKLSHQQITDRLLTANPWHGKYTDAYKNFRSFAIAQSTQSGDERYVNLVAMLPVDNETPDFEVLTRSTNAVQLAIPLLCGNYLNNSNIQESIKYLNRLDRKSLSYSDVQIVELLDMLFDEDENLMEQYPHLFSSETEVRRMKADCASILSSYPHKDGLIAFERACINPVHKLTVYSFVFRVMYDEDIYHMPQYSLEAIGVDDSRTFYVYAYFMRTVLLSQLRWNTAYHFFYKVWRYLKLYITTILIEGPEMANDSFITDAMVQYDHYETVFRSEYSPFRDNVDTFMSISQLPLQTKRHLLAALMSGQVAWFIGKYTDQLLTLSPEEKDVIRKMTASLDYREAALAVYLKYSNNIRKQNIDEAAALGSVFSIHIVSALHALRDMEFIRPRDVDKVWDLAVIPTPSQCILQIGKLRPDFFDAYAPILIPVIFSRQFPFHFYRYTRSRILQQRKTPELMYATLARFDQCAAYYEQCGKPKARKVHRYLSAFIYCLQDMRKEVQEILASTEIEEGIPIQWLAEAKSIHDYASGINKVFQPVTIDDSSRTAGITGFQYTFIQMLQKKLGIQQHQLTFENAEKIAAARRNTERSRADRAKDGVNLLVNYPNVESIMSRDLLLLSTGLNAMKAENLISADEQLVIAVELYNGNFGTMESPGREYRATFQEFLDTYKMILNRHLSLSSWAQHAESIRKYLISIHEAGDFMDMIKNVLQPCQDLLAPDCSIDRRCEQYRDLLEKLKLIQSPYAARVDSAIRRELETMESGVRLKIELDKNENTSVVSTDGHVYYVIKNIGTKTAQLNNVSLSFQQDSLRSQVIKPAEQCSITELQCGFMTGGRLKLTPGTDASAVHISLRLVDNDTKQVICDTEETVVLASCCNCFTLSKEHKYSCTGKNQTLNPAMLFGRDTQKFQIKEKLADGVVTIYGPSRIGKTSLLNWIEEYAIEHGTEHGTTVMTILFGGEGGLGKGKDYTEGFAKKDYPTVPYSDNYQMSEYLLTQTIIHALTDMTDRLNTVDPEELLSSDDFSQILSILRDSTRSISQRYSTVNRILAKAHVELWLMLDEFQDVVERWNDITLSSDFVEVCNRLRSERQPINNIKLILCGSDDLLRHMAIKDKSVWRETLWDSRVPVGPLDKDSFCLMMQKDKGIANSNITYSNMALRSLYTYTGGVALYGKEIGNVIISHIKNAPDDYRNRGTIYISDVASATQQLITQQNQELASEIKEGIREIYDAVTKNLKFETDKQYLWYIAKWLHDHPDRDKFPESTFTGRELVQSESVLRDSLTIAVERRILNREETEVGGDKFYSFCTIFYYNAFLGTFDGNLNEDLIFTREPDAVDEYMQPGDQHKETPTKTICDLWREMDDFDQRFTLGGMALTARNSDTRKALKEISGDLVDKSLVDNSQEINIETLDNRSVTVNIQSISNTLNGILVSGNDPVAILSGLESLPRLPAYLGDSAPLLLENLDSSDPVVVAEAESKLEASTTRMVSDYLAALVSHEETPEDFCVWKEMGIGKQQYDQLSKSIEPTFMAEIVLAAKLNYIFSLAEGIKETSNPLSDYSPVTIMYCKILEKMLKFYHTDVYSDRVGRVSTKVKFAGREVSFGDLLHMSKADKSKVQNQIMLGAFLYPIDPDYNHDWKLITNYQTYQIAPWKEHGKMLKKVRDIRNASAHGADGVKVDRNKLLHLKELLFCDGGLINIPALRD